MSLTQTPSFALPLGAQCPPQDAIAAQGTVFRIIKTQPIQSNQFETYFELGKAAKSNCAGMAVSLFKTKADAKLAAKKYPYLGKLAAVGTLTNEHGRMREGSNGHINWWHYQNVDRKSCFQQVVAL